MVRDFTQFPHLLRTRPNQELSSLPFNSDILWARFLQLILKLLGKIRLRRWFGRCLPYKHETLGFGPKHPCKSWIQWPTLYPSLRGREQRHVDSWSPVANQPSQTDTSGSVIDLASESKVERAEGIFDFCHCRHSPQETTLILIQTYPCIH